MSFSGSKFAAISVELRVLSSFEEFAFDLGVDERRESVVSPTRKVELSSIKREGTRG